MRRALILLTLFVVAVPAATPQPESSAAVVTPIHVSSAGLDTNLGTAAAPVLTFGRAYQLARPGQPVEVAAGTYGLQSVRIDPTKRSDLPVIFRPAPNATVLLDGPLYVSAQNVTFKRFTFANQSDTSKDELRTWVAEDGSANLTFENIDASFFFVGRATGVRVLGGDYGPCNSNSNTPCLPKVHGGGGMPARNILIDGAVFHDMTTTSSEFHTDGLALFGVDGLVLRNSRFYNNAFQQIIIQNCCGNGGPANVLIENNWIGRPSPRGSGAIDMCKPTPFVNITIRFNSIRDAICTDPNGMYPNLSVYGNIIDLPGTHACPPSQARVAFNVWINGSGATCGGSSLSVRTPPYVNSAQDGTMDYHLTASSRANNFVPTIAIGGCPGSDFDRDRRPRARRCDAGADERGSAILCHRTGSRSKPWKTLIVRESQLKAHLAHGDRYGSCPRKRKP